VPPSQTPWTPSVRYTSDETLRDVAMNALGEAKRRRKDAMEPVSGSLEASGILDSNFDCDGMQLTGTAYVERTKANHFSAPAAKVEAVAEALPSAALIDSCRKCEMARLPAESSESCIRMEAVCTLCCKLACMCSCERTVLWVSRCEGCGVIDSDIESDLRCLVCHNMLEACPCISPLLADDQSNCEDCGMHSFQLEVNWMKPSARICKECGKIVEYVDQEFCACDDRCVFIVPHNEDPLDDGMVFHGSCMIDEEGRRICKRCHAGGVHPVDGDSVSDDDDDDDDDEEDSEVSDH